MLGCQLLLNFPDISSQFLYLSLWANPRILWCSVSPQTTCGQEGDAAQILIKPMCSAWCKVMDRMVCRTGMASALDDN